MLKIAVVEDSHEYMGTLLDYLARWQSESGEEAAIKTYSNGAVFLEDFRSDCDIILMDIEMPLTDGMSAAEEIRQKDTDVTIIFITNAPQYAIRGYAVEAFDYMLKPVSYFAFSERLNRAIARRRGKPAKYITISYNRSVQKFDINSIYYIESSNHTLIFHTSAGDFETIDSMRDVESKLSQDGFVRGNNYYLINLRHVDGVRGNDAIVHGEALMLSRQRKADFLSALAFYVGGSLK